MKCFKVCYIKNTWVLTFCILLAFKKIYYITNKMKIFKALNWNSNFQIALSMMPVWYWASLLWVTVCILMKQKSVSLHKCLSYYSLLSVLVISPFLSNVTRHNINPQRNDLPEANTQKRRKWQKGWDRETELMSLQKRNKKEKSRWVKHVRQSNLHGKKTN